ncbi:MAG: Radical SAM superfamily enzyme [Candidatus Methanohalarchaeum thermophilum]|uniref:Radical SAM superfamily enzyme n=1 Tax=Methanohalarchaeum thermophilum TaxID=1903181 RepID=A0A1Q6DY13_METT1|nr:MAG: Radical SAM superfamily enzyme [Candidatus Methanohalarchaeum thermophilum]
MECVYCDYWKRSYEDELVFEEILEILDDAAEAGIGVYTVTGGEPLLRDDLSEILEEADDRGFYTVLVTNGLLLGKHDLEPDMLSISLDTLNKKKYKEITGRNKLEKVKKSIQEASSTYSNVVINTVIHEDNYNEISDLVKFANKWDVGINFEPVSSYFEGCPKIEPQKLKKAAEELINLKKEYGCVKNSDQYLKLIKNQESFDCLSYLLLRLNPNGEVISPCYELNQSKKTENAKKTNINKIINKKLYKEGIKLAKNCERNCYLSCYAEPSLFTKKPTKFIKEIKYLK